MDNSFGDLPAALFSPAKMFYIACTILAASKARPNEPWWEFFAGTTAFPAVEIFHNNYWGIRSNIAAERHRLKQPAGLAAPTHTSGTANARHKQS